MLKKLYIIGPNLKSSFEVIQPLCLPNECRIIGDGVASIPFHEIEQLANQIDSFTQININAHGNSVPSVCNKTDTGYSCDQSSLLTHRIEVDAENRNEIFYTHDLLRQLSQLAGNIPLQINLLSCFAGIATENLSNVLPAGSMVTTFGPANNTLSTKILAHLLQEMAQQVAVSPAQAFITHLTHSAVSNASFTAIVNTGIQRTCIATLSLEDTVQQPLPAFKAIIHDCQNLYIRAKGLTPQHARVYYSEDTLKEINITKEAIETYRLGYLFSALDSAQKSIEAFTFFSTAKPQWFATMVNQKIYGASLLSHAVIHNNSAAIEFLLNIPNIEIDQYNDNDGCTPLYAACHRGLVEIAKLLLSKGANPNLTSNTPHTPLLVAIERNHPDIVALLLQDARTDVNQPKDQGITPLWLAVSKQKEAIVELLLRHPHIAVNQSNDYHITSLQKAVIGKNPTIVKMLIDCSVNLDYRMGNNSVALRSMKDNPHIEELLIAGKVRQQQLRDYDSDLTPAGGKCFINNYRASHSNDHFKTVKETCPEHMWPIFSFFNDKGNMRILCTDNRTALEEFYVFEDMANPLEPMDYHYS